MLVTHAFARSSCNTRPRRMCRRVLGLQIVGPHAPRSRTLLPPSRPCPTQHTRDNYDGTAALESHDPTARRRRSYVTPMFAWSSHSSHGGAATINPSVGETRDALSVTPNSSASTQDFASQRSATIMAQSSDESLLYVRAKAPRLSCLCALKRGCRRALCDDPAICCFQPGLARCSTIIAVQRRLNTAIRRQEVPYVTSRRHSCYAAITPYPGEDNGVHGPAHGPPPSVVSLTDEADPGTAHNNSKILLASRR